MATRRHPTSSSTHPKDVQQRSLRHPGSSTFEFPNHRFSRPIPSFILKAIKRWQHHVRGFFKSNPQLSAVSVTKHKRSKYPHVRPPPPLANDLALMQFIGGGKIETHIKCVMKEQAKAAGGSREIIVGIADVYRDSTNGGTIWWDADEEIEYAHLLGGVDGVKTSDDARDAIWEGFGTTNRRSWSDDRINRRSTESTGSTADSEFDLKYLIPPPEVDSYPTFTSGELNDNVLASTRVGGEGMDALSLPSRASRQARHLLRPVSLVDLQAFGKLIEHGQYSQSNSALSAQIFSDRNPVVGEARARAHRRKPKGAVHRQMSLLKFNSTPSKSDAIRMQFIKDSFTPLPPLSGPLPAGRFRRDVPSWLAVI